MEVKFFTMQPFTINVSGTMHSLSNRQKAIIIIAGIAGLALLGIGAIFTFYGASYLLRKHLFQKISKKELSTSQLPHHNSTSNTKEPFLEKMKTSIPSIVEELKPIDKLKSIQFSIAFQSNTKTLQLPEKTISSQPSKNLQDMLILAIEESIIHAKEIGMQNEIDTRVKWSVIAQDKDDILHGVIGRDPLSFLGTQLEDFYRNVDLKNKNQLMEIISKKLKD